MIALVLGLLLASSCFLLVYGVNLLHLSWRALRLRPAAAPRLRGAAPNVCVQIPIYNEHHVAARVIDAAAAFDWPRSRLELQVLDDSDDDTVELVAARVAHWRERGVRIEHVRRPDRTGYKAGALAHGMTLTSAPFLAVFDADFRPEPDFLRLTMGAFADPGVAFVQARWGHLNEGYSLLTRLQALMVDFHFQVEQLVRPARGYFTNFTGSAGVWRREAVEAAGGWSAETLTEDLDLSYRAQLLGWRAVYAEAVVVRQELPVDANGYRGQQSRWATGSFQTARRLLPRVLRAPLPAGVKLQAALHLLGYLAPVLMLLQIACYPALVVLRTQGEIYEIVRLPAFVNLLSLAPAIGVCAAQARLGRRWWRRIPLAAGWSFLGAGTSYTVLLAALRSFRPGGRFVRTPKYRIEAPGQEWQASSYARVLDARAPQEALLGAALLVVGLFTIGAHWWLLALYSYLFAFGFLALAGLSLFQALEVLTLRRLGRGALAAVRGAGPALLVFGLCTGLLAAFARLPDPFEDSYQHWLMAASFAASGRLVDPLFGMQDTWLPGYQLVAGALLKVFGLWRLDVLKLADAGLGLVLLVLVHRLAPSRRQARTAVLLLGLNPIFLLVSGGAVAEPLLTVLLTGAALAGVRRRPGWAAGLALAACLVGTKAWIWVAAVGLASLLPALARLRRERPVGSSRAAGAWRELAWVPALAAAAVLQLAFAPASHSAARGTQELASAVARGSAGASGLARAWQLLGTFGLATLPSAAPALPGLAALRRDEARLRWLHLPALAYLAVVVALVAAGTYTGSHRYLYPALPSLALLAAAALDRAPVAATAIAGAGAALLLAGFVPVFQGFAADNRGLEAAGLAAARVPGQLLTDSPVAAYFSGKDPTAIAGSMALPPGRLAAVAWLRGHGYTSVVLEDISYYRAGSVLPDLADGRPQGPFLALGDEAQYTVPGGKVAYAYRLPPGRWEAPLFGDVAVSVEGGAGAGKTAGLAHGAHLVRAGAPLLGEGMGFGVPAARYAGGWWFPGSALTQDVSTSTARSWTSVFDLDETGGDGGVFTRGPSHGRIAATYSVVPGGLRVRVQVLELAPGVQQVGVLNEESAAFDDYADAGRTLVGPAFGPWMPVSGSWARLRSGSAGVEFAAPAMPGAELRAGRERRGYLDWAGLDYLFGPAFTGTDYTLTVQEAR